MKKHEETLVFERCIGVAGIFCRGWYPLSWQSLDGLRAPALDSSVPVSSLQCKAIVASN